MRDPDSREMLPVRAKQVLPREPQGFRGPRGQLIFRFRYLIFVMMAGVVLISGMLIRIGYSNYISDVMNGAVPGQTVFVVNSYVEPLWYKVVGVVYVLTGVALILNDVFRRRFNSTTTPLVVLSLLLLTNAVQPINGTDYTARTVAVSANFADFGKISVGETDAESGKVTYSFDAKLGLQPVVISYSEMEDEQMRVVFSIPPLPEIPEPAGEGEIQEV